MACVNPILKRWCRLQRFVQSAWKKICAKCLTARYTPLIRYFHPMTECICFLLCHSTTGSFYSCTSRSENCFNLLFSTHFISVVMYNPIEFTHYPHRYICIDHCSLAHHCMPFILNLVFFCSLSLSCTVHEHTMFSCCFRN